MLSCLSTNWLHVRDVFRADSQHRRDCWTIRTTSCICKLAFTTSNEYNTSFSGTLPSSLLKLYSAATILGFVLSFARLPLWALHHSVAVASRCTGYVNRNRSIRLKSEQQRTNTSHNTHTWVDVGFGRKQTGFPSRVSLSSLLHKLRYWTWTKSSTSFPSRSNSCRFSSMPTWLRSDTLL